MRASHLSGFLAPVLTALLLFGSVAHGEQLETSQNSPGVNAAGPADAAPELERLSDPDPLYDEEWAEDLAFGGPQIYDPLEKGNRIVFRFNQKLDRWFLSPLKTGYRFIFPLPARHALRRVADNLNTPAYLVNHLLQGEFVDAAETLGAFIVNSTIGWGGLFEPSLEMGWERKSADFGQTMALYGVGAGPYLIVPVIGPTTVRDGMGTIVDRLMQPLTYFMGFGFQIILTGGTGFTEFDEKADKLKALEASSVDLYAALRSAYVQSRENSIEKRRNGDGAAL